MTPHFEWDPKKAQSNLRKHRVSFDEASTIFDDPQFIMLLDEDHSDDEERYISIGMSNKSRLLMVAHTERGQTIRVISARSKMTRQGLVIGKATRNEEEFYQEAG